MTSLISFSVLFLSLCIYGHVFDSFFLSTRAIWVLFDFLCPLLPFFILFSAFCDILNTGFFLCLCVLGFENVGP